MGRTTGRHSKPSPDTFSARSFEAFCLCCERWFTFELGHLLDEGVDPATLRQVAVPCSNCGARVELTPSEVYELYEPDAT